MSKLKCILETALYVDDPDRAQQFYSRIQELITFGLLCGIQALAQSRKPDHDSNPTDWSLAEIGARLVPSPAE